jgi:predicted nucleic acid-binding protein
MAFIAPTRRSGAGCAASFLMKAHVPVHPVTESTAEIVARIGAEQAAKGIKLPLADLIIGACALELGYAIATANVRDFNRIPGLTVVSL